MTDLDHIFADGGLATRLREMGMALGQPEEVMLASLANAMAFAMAIKLSRNGFLRVVRELWDAADSEEVAMDGKRISFRANKLR